MNLQQGELFMAHPLNSCITEMKRWDHFFASSILKPLALTEMRIPSIRKDTTVKRCS